MALVWKRAKFSKPSLPRDITVIAAALLAFALLRLYFGGAVDAVIPLAAIVIALVLGVAVLASAYRPRGS